MTICDKINEVGEILEENLNDRGVSCTFGTGTGESTVLDMVEMVNGTNFKGSSDVNLKIGANRPYLLTGETTDVVVKLEDGLCEPLNNKNVTIEQSLFRDNGTTTSHNDNWNGLQYMTRTDTGTIINNTSGSALFDAVYINSSALPFTNEDLVVEFEIVENPSSTNKFRFDGQTLCDGESYRQYDFSFAQNETGKFKFVYDSTNNTIAKYKNGTYVDTYNHHFCGKMGFLFRLDSGASIKIKDFIIYKTINGVTDGKGEFALYDVSVTDNTIFNATYGTETATTNVYLCEFIDYATTSNHNDHYTNLSNQYIHLTRTDGGTTLTSDYTGTGTINMSVADNSNTVINFDLDSSSYMVEMDLLDSQAKSTLQITKSGDNAYNYDSYNYKDKAPCKVRIKVTKTRNEFYVDDTRVTARDTTNNMFNLIIPVNSTAYNMKFRNLRVYRI